MKKCKIFFRKNGIFSRRSKICSPKFFQTIFRLFAIFCTFSEKIWSKRNENRLKSTTRSPQKNPAFWGSTSADLREVCARRVSKIFLKSSLRLTCVSELGPAHNDVLVTFKTRFVISSQGDIQKFVQFSGRMIYVPIVKDYGTLPMVEEIQSLPYGPYFVAKDVAKILDIIRSMKNCDTRLEKHEFHFLQA